MYTISDPALVITLSSDFSAQFTASNALCETNLALTTDNTDLTAKLVLNASSQTITLPFFEDSLALAQDLNSWPSNLAQDEH